MKIIIFFVILAIGVLFTVLKYQEEGHEKIIAGIIASIAISVFSSFLYDGIKTFFRSDEKSSQETSSTENSSYNDENMYDQTTDNIFNDVSSTQNIDEPSIIQQDNSEDSGDSRESVTPTTYIEDVSDKDSFSGNIIVENQQDIYKFIPSVDGTYRFDTNLSSGGSVRIRVSGENEGSISYNYDALSIDLEAKKTYMLSVEYRNTPCDYTVYIGIPIPANDISDELSISGSITYQDQKDHYYYTAPVTGTYRFYTNLSSGGSVRVRISGENGKSISYNNDALTIDLEEGKKYILSIEYRNGTCDYTVNIGVPIPVNDISDSLSVSGSITYQDQKDHYYYTAPVTGTYRFYTDLSSGGSVRVRISGENEKSISYNNDALTIDLEAGKKYILSIEYRNGTCDYTVNIGVPIPVHDISGSFSVSGNITYQDQKDHYYYTAPITGTYHFNTNLSSGGSVRVRISGENGRSISYNNDALTIDLEAGKNYILSIEYRNSVCSYETFIVTP